MKKKHDKMIYLGKTKANSMGVLISKDLIDSNINHHELSLKNNVLKVYDDMKQKINNLKTSSSYGISYA